MVHIFFNSVASLSERRENKLKILKGRVDTAWEKAEWRRFVVVKPVPGRFVPEYLRRKDSPKNLMKWMTNNLQHDISNSNKWYVSFSRIPMLSHISTMTGLITLLTNHWRDVKETKDSMVLYWWCKFVTKSFV